MRKWSIILGLLILTAFVKAQVKQNENGFYLNPDGTYYTGVLETNENGVKKSVLEVNNGQLNGEATYYYASGKLMETGYFNNGQRDGKWIRYNESGIMVGLAAYSMGKKHGTWLVWDDNGKKRFEMNYKMGEKSGVWFNWDENGQLLSSKDFGQIN